MLSNEVSQHHLQSLDVIGDSSLNQLGWRVHARLSDAESSGSEEDDDTEYEENAEKYGEIGTGRSQAGTYNNITRNAGLAAGSGEASTEDHQIDQRHYPCPYLELKDRDVIHKPKGERERKPRIQTKGKHAGKIRKGYITKDESRLHPDKYKRIVVQCSFFQLRSCCNPVSRVQSNLWL